MWTGGACWGFPGPVGRGPYFAYLVVVSCGDGVGIFPKRLRRLDLGQKGASQVEDKDKIVDSLAQRDIAMLAYRAPIKHARKNQKDDFLKEHPQLQFMQDRLQDGCAKKLSEAKRLRSRVTGGGCMAENWKL